MTTIPVNVTLPVTLITCVTAIRANSGDKLMIVNSVCIGKLENAPAPPVPPAPPPTPAILPPKEGMPSFDQIISACRETPSTTMKICDRMGLTREDNRGRAYVGYHLRRMAADGLISQVEGPNGPSRVCQYVRLVAPQPLR